MKRPKKTTKHDSARRRAGVWGVFVLLLIGASPAVAADVVWCGADGGSFTNAANWVGGTRPGAQDVCIFHPTGALTVLVPNGASYASGMRFESGDTTFAVEGSFAYTGFASATGTVEVAEGATFTMDTVRLEQKNKTYRKTGRGTWFQKGDVCRDSSTSSACVLLVEEGTLDCVTGSNHTALNIDTLAVSTGASCFIRGYNRVLGPCALRLDGSLDISIGADTPAMTVAGLDGCGTLSASATSRLVVKPTADCTFSGHLTGMLAFALDSTAEGRLTLGCADALADAASVTVGNHLRFAPGIGTFLAPGWTVPTGESLCLADTTGQPVTLLATRAMTLTGRALTGSGQFAVSNETTEAALTLGDGTTDAELSDFGALGVYAKGKLVYRNAQPLVQSTAPSPSGCRTSRRRASR